jgi:hypothetical protein
MTRGISQQHLQHSGTHHYRRLLVMVVARVHDKANGCSSMVHAYLRSSCWRRLHLHANEGQQAQPRVAFPRLLVDDVVVVERHLFEIWNRRSSNNQIATTRKQKIRQQTDLRIYIQHMHGKAHPCHWLKERATQSFDFTFCRLKTSCGCRRRRWRRWRR